MASQTNNLHLLKTKLICFINMNRKYWLKTKTKLQLFYHQSSKNKPKPSQKLTLKLTILCLKDHASRSTRKFSLKILKLSNDTILKIWWKIPSLLEARSSSSPHNLTLSAVWALETGRDLISIVLIRMLCSLKVNNKTQWIRTHNTVQLGALGIMSTQLRRLLSGRILKTYLIKPRKDK